MALQKTIANGRTGHTNDYWRLTGIHIDALSGAALIILSGYASAGARAAARMPDDQREWTIHGAAFAAVAFGAASGATVYDVIAQACYALVKTARRPIPPDTVMNEDGSLTLPNGEVWPADQVEHPEDGQGAPTIPSEFADAADV